MTDSSSPAVAPRPRRLLISIWLRRRLVARLLLVAAIVAGAATYIIPRDWVSGGAFVVQDNKPDAGQGLAGLTQKFGIDLSSGGTGYSPRFYAWLMQSYTVLGDIAVMKVKAPAEGAGQTVMDVLKIKGKTFEIRRARAIEYLDKNVIKAALDQKVDITSYDVKTDDPYLSLQIAQALFQHVNDFITEHHQSRASVERKFVEARIVSSNKELMAAEDALADYMTRNRAYQRAPEQTVEFTRLSRKVRELEAVVSTLAESYEKARIEEVRDSPVLSEVDPSTLPALPEKRSRIEWVVVACFLTFAGFVATLFARRYLGIGDVVAPGDPYSFADIWPTMKAEMRRPWTLLMREPTH